MNMEMRQTQEFCTREPVLKEDSSFSSSDLLRFILLRRHKMSVRRSRDDYEDFEDRGAEVSAPPQPPLPPDSLDPGAHIEMSAAVSGVVPDGE
ncbi:hypothetical protein E2C01_053508 [Portunus trituberculatus]|uniref:Uncharacterized protein n=1 Tax=Portunus trituberculatus TaxID=210409 RepID=A0A5B7GQZ2_PORTR|nr:hypothetical protein [Portunus trituberculatus]